MKKEYDFSKSQKNPYLGRAKKPVTIRLDESTVTYFKRLAAKTGIPYQTLINLFLRDCAENRKEPAVSWITSEASEELDFDVQGD